MNRHPAINPRDLIDPKCDGHLSNWANWMQNYQVGIGYDRESAVVIGYGSMTVDDMYAVMDRNNAKVINAIIYGLTQLQQCAIHNVYLADVWKSVRVDMGRVFVEAAAEVWKQAQRRGLD